MLVFDTLINMELVPSLEKEIGKLLCLSNLPLRFSLITGQLNNSVISKSGADCQYACAHRTASVVHGPISRSQSHDVAYS